MFLPQTDVVFLTEEENTLSNKNNKSNAYLPLCVKITVYILLSRCNSRPCCQQRVGTRRPVQSSLPGT